jgi:hypothetical protein
VAGLPATIPAPRHLPQPKPDPNSINTNVRHSCQSKRLIQCTLFELARDDSVEITIEEDVNLNELAKRIERGTR